MKKSNSSKKPSINKNDFIEFLASATPEEVNQYILEKGKPRKPVWPMFFFPRKEEQEKK